MSSVLGKKKDKSTKIIRTITKVKIEGIWESYNILWKDPYPDVNILAGVNGSGKSTLMDIIVGALKRDFGDLKTKPPHLVEITFNTGEMLRYMDRKLEVEPESEINFDYISTFDRKESDILLSELQSKLDQFTRLLNTLLDNRKNIEAIKEAQELQTTLESYANRLFCVRDKKIVFSKNFEIDEKGIEIVFVKPNGKIIKPPQLSSGEKQIMLILLTVLLQRDNPQILLMDEPEISLHPDWQEELLTIIREINKNAQIILVTHSPALVIQNWFGQIIDIETIFLQGAK